MENLELPALSYEQWFQMFVLAMAILVFCSLVIMISIWIVSSKLSDISEKLDKITPKDKDL